MTAACHDRVDTFDTARMRQSLALQRLNETKSLNGARDLARALRFPGLSDIAEMVLGREDHDVRSRE